MSGLEQLAADLAFAAGSGATHLREQLTHAAATKAEVGVSVAGSGLIKHHGVRAATETAADPEKVAASMATKAADGGVRLVAGGGK